MNLVQIVVIFVVVGVLLWLINTYLPMDEKIKRILNVAIVVVMVLWLLGLLLAAVGLWNPPHGYWRIR